MPPSFMVVTSFGLSLPIFHPPLPPTFPPISLWVFSVLLVGYTDLVLWKSMGPIRFQNFLPQAPQLLIPVFVKFVLMLKLDFPICKTLTQNRPRWTVTPSLASIPHSYFRYCRKLRIALLQQFLVLLQGSSQEYQYGVPYFVSKKKKYESRCSPGIT